MTGKKDGGNKGSSSTGSRHTGSDSAVKNTGNNATRSHGNQPPPRSGGGNKKG